MADFSKWIEKDGFKAFIESFFLFARGCIYDSSVKEREEKNAQAIFVLHDTYLKVLDLAKDADNQVENSRAYIKRIIFNKAMDFNNDNSRNPLKKSYSVDVICDSYFQSFKEEAEKNNILNLINRDISPLHGKIFAAMVSGKTQRDIAATLGIAVGGVAERIKEVRKYIKKLGF